MSVPAGINPAARVMRANKKRGPKLCFGPRLLCFAQIVENRAPSDVLRPAFFAAGN